MKIWKLNGKKQGAEDSPNPTLPPRNSRSDTLRWGSQRAGITRWNFPPHQTSEEVAASLTGLQLRPRRNSAFQSQSQSQSRPVGDIPEALDWRDKGCVTEVKNQVSLAPGASGRSLGQLLSLSRDFFFPGRLRILLGLQRRGSSGSAGEAENREFGVPECPEPGGLLRDVREQGMRRGVHDGGVPVHHRQRRHRVRGILSLHGSGGPGSAWKTPGKLLENSRKTHGSAVAAHSLPVFLPPPPPLPPNSLCPGFPVAPLLRVQTHPRNLGTILRGMTGPGAGIPARLFHHSLGNEPDGEGKNGSGTSRKHNPGKWVRATTAPSEEKNPMGLNSPNVELQREKLLLPGSGCGG